jgi:mono/diheme cytochrome c family protein
MKTGGGNERQGLGKGIHWHVQNDLYYLPTDKSEQEISLVRVVENDGSLTDYVDIESPVDLSQVDPGQFKKMDCMTCHNRITHLVEPPADRVDQMLARQLIDPAIPEIRLRGTEVLSATYASIPDALTGIAGLKNFYQTTYPDYYSANAAKVDAAIAALQGAYEDSTFPEQKSDWTTHPNNVGHKDFPGCFRCHDGKHLNDKQEAIRLECNLCHSIPVVVGPDKFVADIEISRGPEPASHLNPNWLGLHRDAFDQTCSACHTTENAGGTDNSSFCSNSACHGSGWTYAGLDAPALKPVLEKQLPPKPTPAPEQAPATSPTGALTYDDTIGPLFKERCGSCHGSGALGGLNLTTYATALQGGKSGAVIVPGDPTTSLLIEKQSGSTPHFGQLSASELQLVMDWIKAGAPEN